jgi:acyl carrier protein
MTIEQRLIAVIREVLDQPENHRGTLPEITPRSNFIEDLQCDSLDLIEIVLGVEDAFEIDIADEDVEGIKTVQNAIDYLTKHVKAA